MTHIELLLLNKFLLYFYRVRTYANHEGLTGLENFSPCQLPRFGESEAFQVDVAEDANRREHHGTRKPPSCIRMNLEMCCQTGARQGFQPFERTRLWVKK